GEFLRRKPFLIDPLLPLFRLILIPRAAMLRLWVWLFHHACKRLTLSAVINRGPINFCCVTAYCSNIPHHRRLHRQDCDTAMALHTALRNATAKKDKFATTRRSSVTPL